MNTYRHSIPTIIRALLPAAVLAAGTGMLVILRQAILESPSDLGIQALLRPQAAAWTLLLATTTGCILLYLLSVRGLYFFRRAYSNSNYRLILYLGSSLTALIPGVSKLSAVQPQVLVLLGFTYLLLLDLFLDYRNNSLTWAIIWTLFYAALSTVFFQKYTLERDQYRLFKYAAELLRDGLPADENPGNRVYLQALSPSTRIHPSQRILFRDSTGAATALGFLNSDEWPSRVDALRHAANVHQWNAPSSVREGLTGLYKGSVVAYAENNRQEAILVDYPAAGYHQVLPYFAIQFLVLFIVSAFIAWVRVLRRWIPADIPLPFHWGNQFRNRLQRLVFGVVLGSLVFFTLIAIPFFRMYAGQEIRSKIFQQAIQVAKRLESEPVHTFSADKVDSLLRSQATQIGFDLDVYTPGGALIGSSARKVFHNTWRQTALSPPIIRSLATAAATPLIRHERIQHQPIQVLYLPIKKEAEKSGIILSIPFSTTPALLSDGLRSFISAMLMVSVFLLLISGGVAMLFANQLSEPLSEISRHLRNFQMGDTKPLFWKTREDEIGELVTAYNEALVLIEESTEQLRQSEREKAWREMAKQVAHEIKNPLTPMKLSIQYLVYAFQQDPSRIHTLLPKAAETLSEQIDVLARIATEFSNFAQMPQADNHPMELKEVLLHATDLFRQQLPSPDALQIHLPEQPVWVFADRKQFLRVFNNLLQNALQAIPDGTSPRIHIQLDVEATGCLLQFRDNGTGIPAEIHSKVFSPNFTTKSSGMGLGLAICRNIIQQADGKIYFETAQGIGTTFFIQLPLWTA